MTWSIERVSVVRSSDMQCMTVISVVVKDCKNLAKVSQG